MEILKLLSRLEEEKNKIGYKLLDVSPLERGGQFRRVNEITYIANQHAYTRELLIDSDGSYVLALTDKEMVVMLLQLRPGLEKPFQLELPAGSVNPGEEPRFNAIEELAQEAGGKTEFDLILLGSGPVLAGRSPQETHFYLAQGVKISPGEQSLDTGEIITPILVPIELAMDLAIRLMNSEGEIGVDPKVLVAMVLGSTILPKFADRRGQS